MIIKDFLPVLYLWLTFNVFANGQNFPGVPNFASQSQPPGNPFIQFNGQKNLFPPMSQVPGISPNSQVTNPQDVLHSNIFIPDRFKAEIEKLSSELPKGILPPINQPTPFGPQNTAVSNPAFTPNKLSLTFTNPQLHFNTQPQNPMLYNPALSFQRPNPSFTNAPQSHTQPQNPNLYNPAFSPPSNSFINSPHASPFNTQPSPYNRNFPFQSPNFPNSPQTSPFNTHPSLFNPTVPFQRPSPNFANSQPTNLFNTGFQSPALHNGNFAPQRQNSFANPLNTGSQSPASYNSNFVPQIPSSFVNTRQTNPFNTAPQAPSPVIPNPLSRDTFLSQQGNQFIPHPTFQIINPTSLGYQSPNPSSTFPQQLTSNYSKPQEISPTASIPQQINPDATSPQNIPQDPTGSQQITQGPTGPQQMPQDPTKPQQISSDSTNAQQFPQDPTSPQTTDSDWTVSQTTDSGSTAPQTTDSGSTVSQTTDSGSTVSQTTDSASTISQTTGSGSTASQTTDSGSTVSQITDSGSTVSQTTDSGSTVSQTTDSASTVSQTTDSASTIPQTTDSGSTVPQITDSGSTVPEQTDSNTSPQTTNPGGQPITSASESSSSTSKAPEVTGTVPTMPQHPSGNPLGDMRIVCIFNNRHYFKNGFKPAQIQSRFCTHLNYEFAMLDPKTSEMMIAEPELDIGLRMYQEAVDLKNINPRLKVLISLGGWADSTKKYSDMAADPAKRKNFIEKSIQFMKGHGFDGLDLAWEYPNCWQGACGVNPPDKKNYNALLSEMKQAYGPENLLLSVSVGAIKREVEAAYDVPQVSKNVDYINIMTYDMHGPWEPRTGHHVQFGAMPSDTDKYCNVKGGMQVWVEKGADKKKCNMGLAFYARTYRLKDPTQNGMGAPAIGPGAPGPITKEGGILNYHEVCMYMNSGNWTEKEHEQAGFYAYSGDQWACYDPPMMMVKKVTYVVENKFGGVLVKDTSGDDFNGNCFNMPSPLLTIVKRQMIHAFRRTNSKKN